MENVSLHRIPFFVFPPFLPLVPDLYIRFPPPVAAAKATCFWIGQVSLCWGREGVPDACATLCRFSMTVSRDRWRHPICVGAPQEVPPGHCHPPGPRQGNAAPRQTAGEVCPSREITGNQENACANFFLPSVSWKEENLLMEHSFKLSKQTLQISKSDNIVQRVLC